MPASDSAFSASSRRDRVGARGSMVPASCGSSEVTEFEIKPRRQTEIGMRRPRKAVDAAMLAAAIGIDGAVEADVGGIIARDHLSRGVDLDRCLEGRQLLQALPAIVEGDARLGLVS